MFVSAMGIFPLCEEMENALKAGKSWMAYSSSETMDFRNQPRYFSSEDGAEKYCLDRGSGEERYISQEIKPVLELLKATVNAAQNVSEWDYVHINRKGEISITYLTNPDQNGLYNPEGNAFTDALIDHWEKTARASRTQNDPSSPQTPAKPELPISSPDLKLHIMNQENLEYLKKNLLYAGFEDKLNADLEKSIRLKVPEFVLKHEKDLHNRKIETQLHFKRGDQSDMYFFNKFDAKLTSADGSVEREQTFYMNNGRGFTLKEAANLLDGRAVNKDFKTEEGKEYNAWVQLDFAKKTDAGNYEMKRFHENYGYNLSQNLDKFPIKESQGTIEKEKLMRSLERGNLQMVTIPIKGEDQKFFIAANPQFKNLDVYNSQGKQIRELDGLGESRKEQQATKQKAGVGSSVASDSSEEKQSPSEKVKQVATNKGKGSKDDDDEDLLQKNGKKKAPVKNNGKNVDGPDELIHKKSRKTTKGQHL